MFPSMVSLKNMKLHLLSSFSSSHHFSLPHLSTLINPCLRIHPVMNPSSTISLDLITNKSKRRSVSSQVSAKLSPPNNLSVWTKWVLGSILLLTVPFYKRILKIGDRVEKTAENTVEIIEKVAEETEKIVSDVGGALPDGNLKQDALEVERFAEEVDKDAKIVEVFLHEVDKIKEELEELVDPNIEKKVKVTTIRNADLPKNKSNTEE